MICLHFMCGVLELFSSSADAACKEEQRSKVGRGIHVYIGWATSEWKASRWGVEYFIKDRPIAPQGMEDKIYNLELDDNGMC